MDADRVVVIGAGVAGLVAALELACRGVAVTVVERGDAPGGKMREVAVGGARLDAGPTVFTMRWVFDELFAAAGVLARRAPARCSRSRSSPATPGARDERLDLFADTARSADAIAAFAGLRRRAAISISAPAPGPSTRPWRDPSSARRGRVRSALVQRFGLAGLGDLWRISPFATLWQRARRATSTTRGCGSCSGATPPIAARRRFSHRRP